LADLGARYASALFDISEEGGLQDDYLEQALFLCKALKEDEALRVLTHPRISLREKNEFVDKAFSGQIHEHLMGFLQLVITKNREAFLLPALTRLIDMIKAHKNQTTAKIASAVPLSDAQAAQLTETLSRKLGKQVELTVLVDPSIIAGISIHVDGYFLDRTVKTMLKDMKETVRRGAANDS